MQSQQQLRDYYSSIFVDTGNNDRGGNADHERQRIRRRIFHNIDKSTNFAYYMRLLQDAETTNFVLDFGDQEAWSALDLEDVDFARLLERPVCINLTHYIYMHMTGS